MKIAVLGTGTVGRTLAARLAELGHTLTLGTRDPAATASRAEPDAMGAAPFAPWAAGNPGIVLATFADAVAGAELIVNATHGAASLEVLALAGAGNLGGKIILDVANPWISATGCRRPCWSRTPIRWESRSSEPIPRPGSSNR